MRMMKKQTETGFVPSEEGTKHDAHPKRWSARRKMQVVMRMLRGESIDAISREIGVEIYRIEQWRDRALVGIETALRDRTGDPVSEELDAAMKRIGEITMENELLRERCRKKGPLGLKR